jgi:hypothetical protein
MKNQISILLITFLVSLTTANTSLSAADGHESIVINEFMASNSSTLIKDPQGQYDDWIELYNKGPTAVNISGMYLTDDLSEPNKWQIPAGTSIPAYGYLLIWADNDVTDTGLHANFKLSADGEEIGLFDTDGFTLLDSVVFSEQSTDASYGRYPDGSDQWQYMLSPTPLLANTSIYVGVVSEPQFSVEHDFFNAPFYVTIFTDTNNVEIYYTLSGREPTDNVIGTIRHYDGPILINKTTCLRARAYKSGYKPSAIETQTYLFVSDVITQSDTPYLTMQGAGWPSGNINDQLIDYGMDPDVTNDPKYKDLMDDALLSIPSISLVTNLDNLFSASTGIYVNALNSGIYSERPVSLELINPDGSKGFQIDAGLRMRGGYSRNDGCPKHSFRVYFRSEYGQSTLNFPLFGDEGADKYNIIDLATPQNFSWSFKGSGDDSPGQKNTFLRDIFSRDLQRQMGQPYTRSRYYHLYINGQYWGLYYTQERAEKSYAQSYLGGNGDDYDVIKVDAGPSGPYEIVAIDGNLNACRRLWNAAQAGFSTNEAYYRVQGMNPDGTVNPAYEKLIDIDNLIDYMIDYFYVGDRDSPLLITDNQTTKPNNYFGIYNRKNPDGFKFFRYDAEWSMLTGTDYRENRVNMVPTPSKFEHINPHWLHYRFTANSEYKMHFADHVHRYLYNNAVLTPTGATSLLKSRKEQIEFAIIAESARWGDAKYSTPRTKDNAWIPEVNDFLIKSYFPSRTSSVLSQFSSYNLYPMYNYSIVEAPEFYINGQAKRDCQISAGDKLSMTTYSGRKDYYTLDGSDPRLIGASEPTTGSKTLVPESAAKKAFVPTAAISNDWRSSTTFNDSNWISGSGGVGYETETGYEYNIQINVKAQMYGKNTSCYIRIPFTITDDINNITSLTLKIRYDDGFVAYLNGTQICRVNSPSSNPAWNAAATTSHSDSQAIQFMTWTFSASYASYLKKGQNILAIHGLNYPNSTDPDFLISAQMDATVITSPGYSAISPSAIQYTTPITLTKSTKVKARILNGVATWSALNEAIYAVGPVAENLRITEIMYNPADTNNPNDPNKEFVELKNIGTETLNLNLAKFTKGIDFTFPDINLAPNQYIVVVKDPVAFIAQYGASVNIAGQYSGSLANDGERIRLEDAIGRQILDFTYCDGWRKITDGDGFSLTAINPASSDSNEWSQKDFWRASALSGGSPGWDDSGVIPNPGAVVINEIFAYSTSGGSDWIELHNTTTEPINIGGWFISDSDANLTKYEIAAGTTVAPGGYIVFDDRNHFDNPSTGNPGCHTPFDLSRNGETVYLSSGLAGSLTGYRQSQDYGTSEPGVSFGRYFKSSTGDYDFVAMSATTPGAANAEPKTGPVVINEIMYYNPAFSYQDAEYIELYNISSLPIVLYDYALNAPWKFTDGIDYNFPADSRSLIPAGGYLIVARDPNFFISHYGSAPVGVNVLGPYNGELSNSGEKLELSSPGEPDGLGGRYYIRMDRVNYSDGSHPENCPGGVDLWPVDADGTGLSLNRKNASGYGNDVSNWQAAVPSAGKVNE